LVVGEGVGSQQRRTQIVIGERSGVLVKDVADEAHSVLRKSGEDMVIASHRVDDVAEVELYLRQPKPRDRILGPETRKFYQRLLIGRWPAPAAGSGCCSISSMKRKRGHQC
jgi:hypothetical protein